MPQLRINIKKHKLKKKNLIRKNLSKILIILKSILILNKH